MTSAPYVFEIHHLRESGGFAPVAFALVEVSGPDAATFLQARTTNDVLALRCGQGQPNALLSRTGHLLAYFSLYRHEQGFFIVAESDQIPTIIAEIEKYHFRENVEIFDRRALGEIWTVEGSKGLWLLSQAPEVADQKVLWDKDVFSLRLWGAAAIVFKKSVSGEEGYFIFVQAKDAQAFVARLAKAAAEAGLIRLSAQALEIARIEAGLPRYGVDMSACELITDTGLEQVAVSYSKGCYLGQEVVARIKTYSAPRKGLVGLIFPEGMPAILPIDAQLTADGKPAGQLKSSCFSPTLKRTVALAYLDREHRVFDRQLALGIEGQVYPCQVVSLPIYHPPDRREKAARLYERALGIFAREDELRAIELLRQALVLDPLSADCYEALGVILSRQGKLDEAIELMQKLAALDPDSVMAHANLSVFFMQKGNRELAEEEKAIAMTIRMRRLAQEAAAQKQKVDDDKKKQQEAGERIKMFEQVLEIDSEDLLANYGLGSAYVDLEDYDKAIPYLKKAIAVKPTHSVAYLALGKALAATKRTEEACKTYEQGIEVASRRGDMQPLKEMQACLCQLRSSGAQAEPP